MKKAIDTRSSRPATEPETPGFCAVLCRADALPPCIDPWLSSLSPHRRARYEAQTGAGARTQSLCASLALAEALAFFGYTEREMTYRTAAGGKPFFGDGCPLFFSLSHTAGAAVAVVSSAVCGVDIECPTGRDRMPLAHRFFKPGEAAALEALPESERERAFLRLWTQKESYVKYTGRGLATPFSSFSLVQGVFCADGASPAGEEPVRGLTTERAPYWISVAGVCLPASLKIHEWNGEEPG